jgi:hypothetical protein
MKRPFYFVLVFVFSISCTGLQKEASEEVKVRERKEMMIGLLKKYNLTPEDLPNFQWNEEKLKIDSLFTPEKIAEAEEMLKGLAPLLGPEGKAKTWARNAEMRKIDELVRNAKSKAEVDSLAKVYPEYFVKN